MLSWWRRRRRRRPRWWWCKRSLSIKLSIATRPWIGNETALQSVVESARTFYFSLLLHLLLLLLAPSEPFPIRKWSARFISPVLYLNIFISMHLGAYFAHFLILKCTNNNNSNDFWNAYYIAVFLSRIADSWSWWQKLGHDPFHYIQTIKKNNIEIIDTDINKSLAETLSNISSASSNYSFK